MENIATQFRKLQLFKGARRGLAILFELYLHILSYLNLKDFDLLHSLISKRSALLHNSIGKIIDGNVAFFLAS
jgi:hypothetical protein